MSNLRKRTTRSAFTLIELLVVIAIIAVLIGLLVPAVQKVREAANRMKCTNNLKQLSLALHTFHDTYNSFPSSGSSFGEISWLAFILPFIEQNALGSEIKWDTYAGSHNTDTAGRHVVYTGYRIPVFYCPSQGWERNSSPTDVIPTVPASSPFAHLNALGFAGQKPYAAHYAGVLGPKGINPANGTAYGLANPNDHWGGQATQGAFRNCVSAAADRPTKHIGHAIQAITDGTSNTLLLGERSWVNPVNLEYARYRNWTRGCATTWNVNAKNVAYPINFGHTPVAAGSDTNSSPFGSQHPGGANFAMADGSVRFLSHNINFGTYLALASRNGGEVGNLN
jgi:prepilin-type N-terminal cleavage/methylation domain-containing protein/prepilin-type processing-associated H-X9-DG protein